MQDLSDNCAGREDDFRLMLAPFFIYGGACVGLEAKFQNGLDLFILIMCHVLICHVVAMVWPGTCKNLHGSDLLLESWLFKSDWLIEILLCSSTYPEIWSLSLWTPFNTNL